MSGGVAKLCAPYSTYSVIRPRTTRKGVDGQQANCKHGITKIDSFKQETTSMRHGGII